MKSFKIAFPLVHKKSSLPTFAVFLGVICAIPALMVMWVALLSQFTRVEGSNSTEFYNVYVCIRAVAASVFVAGLAVYDCRRASVALVPAAIMGLISSLMKLIIVFTDYMDKKALADSMGIHPSYSQNYIDMSEAALVLLLLVAGMLYLFGVLKTSFPVIFISVITLVVIMYSVITTATTYEVSEYTIFCKAYGVPLCLSILMICLSSKSKKQIEGTVKYKPRRMRA